MNFHLAGTVAIAAAGLLLGYMSRIGGPQFNENALIAGIGYGLFVVLVIMAFARAQ